MKKHEITLPELGLIIGTRAMASAGAALLLADKLSKDRRKAVGWTLLLVGAITTIPLAMDVFSKK
jgi:H+/gluconate symporter-like permease